MQYCAQNTDTFMLPNYHVWHYESRQAIRDVGRVYGYSAR
jgi:hypothetical protein